MGKKENWIYIFIFFFLLNVYYDIIIMHVGEGMKNRLKKLTNKEFFDYIVFLSKKIEKFLKDKNLKVDYVVPIMRSGAVPAVYISNILNIVKFAPFQVKHIEYKNDVNTIEILFNPLNEINIKKDCPTFLVVEGTHSTGKSAELCIDEILNKIPHAKILYVCVAKKHGSASFKNKVVFEDCAFVYSNDLTFEQCKKLKISSNAPVFPWETMEEQINHPDDLYDNIFF